MPCLYGRYHQGKSSLLIDLPAMPPTVMTQECPSAKMSAAECVREKHKDGVGKGEGSRACIQQADTVSMQAAQQRERKRGNADHPPAPLYD